MDNILVAEGVKQSFPIASGMTGETGSDREFVALHDIDICIPRGKLTILRGRSGSGKTTLMNILSALDYPKEGSVVFEGQNLEKMSEAEREVFRKTNVGFVFQSVALIPMMTAYENVEFVLRLAKAKKGHWSGGMRRRSNRKETADENDTPAQASISGGSRQKRAEECLRLVGLGQRMHHMPQELSGGEQQRVAIARAIAHKPKIIFADEPTAELDTATGLQVMKIFKELISKEGVTIVMTTHDLGLLDIADCIYHLEDGEIVEDE